MMDWTKRLASAFAGVALMAVAVPAAAQVTEIDPDAEIDGDLNGEETETTPIEDAPLATPVGPEAREEASAQEPSEIDAWREDYATAPAQVAEPQAAPESAEEVNPNDAITYQEDDLIGAATGVFGKGAQGLAGLIESILKDQGRPNGYIVGREGGGAFIVGLRYGSGTLYHKIEGERPVYWTGPSIGLDAGANAGSTFVLVYNLYDTQDIFTRFPAAEGQLYAIGGFTVSYVRKGDIVLIPIRVGAGLRAGVNAGYMKVTEKQDWLPF